MSLKAKLIKSDFNAIFMQSLESKPKDLHYVEISDKRGFVKQMPVYDFIENYGTLRDSIGYYEIEGRLRDMAWKFHQSGSTKVLELEEGVPFLMLPPNSTNWFCLETFEYIDWPKVCSFPISGGYEPLDIIFDLKEPEKPNNLLIFNPNTSSYEYAHIRHKNLYEVYETVRAIELGLKINEKRIELEKISIVKESGSNVES